MELLRLVVVERLELPREADLEALLLHRNFEDRPASAGDPAASTRADGSADPGFAPTKVSNKNASGLCTSSTGMHAKFLNTCHPRARHAESKSDVGCQIRAGGHVDVVQEANELGFGINDPHESVLSSAEK